MKSFFRKLKSDENSSVNFLTGAIGLTSKSNKESDKSNYLVIAEKSEQVFRSTIMLAVLFCIVLISLFFMMINTVPESAEAAPLSPEELRIEKAIIRLERSRSEELSESEQIIKKYDDFLDFEKSGTEELVKNPFKYNASGSFGAGSGEDGDMQLFSIMQSEQGNCCMINDKLLYVGDSINGFEILEITDNFVKLKSSGAELILRIEQ